jgi:hypothetical protein
MLFSFLLYQSRKTIRRQVNPIKSEFRSCECFCSFRLKDTGATELKKDGRPKKFKFFELRDWKTTFTYFIILWIIYDLAKVFIKCFNLYLPTKYYQLTITHKIYPILYNTSTEMVSEYQWTACNDIERLPTNIVLVGKDKNGADTFVGRIQHANNQLPATVIPSTRHVCAAHENTVFETMGFEVDCSISKSRNFFKNLFDAFSF